MTVPTPGPAFTVEVDQNPYLPEGAGQVDAIVTLTASGAGAGAAGPAGGEALEMIIVDCSSSMSGGKMRSARDATVAAIQQLRDGVQFALIAGTHTVAQVYPQSGTATVDPRTRAEAIETAGLLHASGGTSIGIWLDLARRIAEEHPGGVRHAILLTDGQNGEPAAALQAALDAAAGTLVCDCRGVGVDWDVEELRHISSALLGGFDIVAEPADLAADFAAMMSDVMGKGLADVALRLWTPKGAAVRFVKQVDPAVEDITGRRTESGPLRADYPLGVWGDEERIYHVCIAVPVQAVGAEMLAGRVSLVRAGSADVLGQGLVKAIWTDDAGLSTRINRQVAHYTGQAELAEVIQEGLAARRDGDERTATARLARAVALAAESGNDGTARLLERVVDVAPDGTVQLRRSVGRADEMTLDTRSTKTVRVRGAG
jgi:hypothetical protein